MRIIKYIIVFVMCAPLFASGRYPSGDNPATLTPERKAVVVKLAKDFGIEKIESITKPFSMSGSHLYVRGDEQLVGNTGRYKELDINFFYEDFTTEVPLKTWPTLDECVMRIVEFVELETEVDADIRILTQNVDPGLALTSLTKIYNSDFTLAPGVDAKDLPSKEVMNMTHNWLEKELSHSGNGYFMLHLPGYVIYFSTDESGIVIHESSQVIY